MKLELDLNKLESISYKLTNTISLLIFNKNNKLTIETKEIKSDVLYYDNKFWKNEPKKLKILNDGESKHFKELLRESEIKSKELTIEQVEKIGELLRESEIKSKEIKIE